VRMHTARREDEVPQPRAVVRPLCECGIRPVVTQENRVNGSDRKDDGKASERQLPDCSGQRGKAPQRQAHLASLQEYAVFSARPASLRSEPGMVETLFKQANKKPPSTVAAHDGYLTKSDHRLARSTAAALKPEAGAAGELLSVALVIANPTKLESRLRVAFPLVLPEGRPVPGPLVNGVSGAGVVALVGGADRLNRMWALTRWPAASALHSDSSAARTAAAMMRARRRAFSPGVVWGPRTPSRSSMALWGSRMVPPPSVPTSRDGIETVICRAPL
jgi:hypothetical protein